MNRRIQGGNTATFLKKVITISMLFLMLFGITGCYKQKPFEIDPFKNCKLIYKGWNKKAIPEVQNEIEYNGNNETISKFLDSIEYKISPNKNLKNGDTVTVKIIYSKEKKKLANVEFTKEEKKFKVKDLIDENREMKNEIIQHETEDGLKYEELNQIIVVNGVEIPVSWHLSEEEIQEYVKYVKETESNEGVIDTHPQEEWNQGTSKTKTNRKTADFLCKDYLDNALTTYDEAYKYGMESSQQFKIVPLVKKEQVEGYTCVFKE